MQALKLPNFLIVPAAGVVNDAGVIELLNVRRRVCRVELPPALVEGDPRADARAAVELGDHLGELGVIARARHRVGAGELFIVVVLMMNAVMRGAEMVRRLYFPPPFIMSCQTSMPRRSQ